MSKRAVNRLRVRPLGYFVIAHRFGVPAGEDGDGDVILLGGVENAGVVANAGNGAGFETQTAAPGRRVGPLATSCEACQ